MSDFSEWIETHKCGAAEPCWKQPDADNGICANCGKPWPQCVSDDGLACLYLAGDMLHGEDLDLLFAEIKRRGLDGE